MPRLWVLVSVTFGAFLLHDVMMALTDPTIAPPLAIDLPEKQFKLWQTRLEQSERLITDHQDDWQANLNAYQGKPLVSSPTMDTVVVPKDFANVNQKAAQLFFRSPDVQLTAELPGLDDAVGIFQAVLNKKLKQAKAKDAIEKMIFDVLCPAGMGCCKVGYENVKGVPIPIQTGMDPLTGEPLMAEAPNIVHEEWFIRRFSPKKLRIPSEFKDNDFDEAPWIGMTFTEPLTTAKRTYGLPEDFKETAGADRQVFHADTDVGSSRSPHLSEDLVEGTEVWYKAAQFDETVTHPHKIRRLVLIKGLDHAAVHEDSPYQRWLPNGQLDPLSQPGFPIDVLTLREFSDSAFQPSDCTITRPLVNEESKFRSQMVRQRDASIPLRWVDINQLDKDDIQKIADGTIGSLIPVKGNGAVMMGEFARAQYPRENYTAEDYIDRNISEAWAMGANQRGVQEDQARTATEIQTQQGNADVRLDKERGRVLDAYLRIVGKFAPLIQLFADQPDYVELEGEQGVQRLAVWDKTTIAGKFAFSAKPDSAIRVDAANDRRQALEFFNYTAKSPYINQQELVSTLARKFNYDPAKLLMQPAPQGPPPPNVSFRFQGQDFMGPAAPIVLAIAQQAGYQIPPEAIAQTQANTQMLMVAQQQMDAAMTRAQSPLPEHGGPADKSELLNKRQTENTGGMPGLPGGGVQ